MARSSLAERITASFYAWEVRGRGWDLARYPVLLEPPFRYCFLLPSGEEEPRPVDDGRRETFLSGLASLVTGRVTEGAVREPEPPFEEAPPFPSETDDELITFALRVASDMDAQPKATLHLVQALAVAYEPVAFELVGSGGRVSLQITCRTSDRDHIEESISGYFPEVALTEREDLFSSWKEEAESVVIDFGLSQEFFLPLQSFPSFSIDPYIALLPALAQAKAGERIALQVLFTRAANPWGKATFEALVDSDGGSLFLDAPEFLPLSKEKFRSGTVATVLRVAAQAETRSRAFTLAKGLRTFLLQFARPGSNELVALENEGYDEALHLQAFLRRESFRTGMLLSVEELVGLVHLPDASVRHAALERSEARTKALPSHHEVGIVLGDNVHRGRRETVRLTDEERLQHVHIVGASGTGKSTLLLALISQDLDAGQGLALLDPHGDLVDDVLARVPLHRLDDVVLFDPSDEAWPVGMNVLAATSSVEKQLLASDLVGIFERLSTSWGDTMGAVLGNAVLAILESDSGGTLLDLRRFLIDEAFRKDFLLGVHDSEIHFFWEKEYPLIGTRSVGPILTRLDTFLRSKLIRNIVGQREPRFTFSSLLEEKRIFLGKLSQGLVGEENASLLGSLIVTKLHQLALSRQRVAREARSPFFLYADEFQHFVTPSMGSLLTEGRKYGVGLILAHQNLSQIRGSPVESALLGNAYTRVVFRVGDEDARRLADGFSFFEGTDLQGLERGEAIARLGSANRDCNLETRPLAVVDREKGEERRQAVIEHSRRAFATAASALREERREEPEVRETKEEPRDERPAPMPRQVESPPTREPTLYDLRPARKPKPIEPPTLGKGGPEHKYLQHLIKRLGEERGFRAVIEEPIGDGRSVDVVLRRDDLALAFEISVNSVVDHEIANIRKCRGGAYARLFFVSASKRKRDEVTRACSTEDVTVIAPEEIALTIDGIEAAEAAETTVRGYAVKINRQAVASRNVTKRREVAQIVAASLARQTANE